MDSNHNIEHLFNQNIIKLGADKTQKFLLAVSGGIDSMVLFDLFRKSKLNIGVAHCNFQLRENESDLDETFIQQICERENVKFHSKKFDIANHKQSYNSSTQMAARELRYDWFKHLLNKYQYDWIVTAHHLTDQIETFILNLSRGTGINGLTGFPTNQNQILRPLFDLTKEQITTYAKENQLVWREDSSNQTDDYIRNKIRHNILPHLKTLHPNFETNFKSTIQKLDESKRLINSQIESLKSEIIINENKIYKIKIKDLKKLNPISTYFHHIFKPYGFIKPNEIIKLMDGMSGSEIQSDRYRIIKNRDFLLIDEIRKSDDKEYLIHELGLILNPVKLELSLSKSKNKTTRKSFDYELIKFPLKIRKRKDGDLFFPDGMKGKKKISKFFKDEKLSKLEKEKIWLLCDTKDQILWIIGKRYDQRFLATDKTVQFLEVKLCTET